MIYGCIGEHLSHSFSKEIHNLFMEYDYVIKEIAPQDLENFIKEKDFRGINVTIPYKKDVIPYLDGITDIAKRIGAVNTIVNNNGKLYGTNSDYFGMTAIINKANIDIENKKVLILGSGGTSKTATVVVEDLNAKDIIRVSRTAKDGCITYIDAVKYHSDADVIVNTTPCGMYPNFNQSPINLENFPNLSGVVDAIYNPLRSNLILQAESKGIKAIDGLYMLVAQAAGAEEFFLNSKIDNTKIDKVYNKIYKDKFNVVLSGMPGCGKSTIGQALANKLNKEFIDTDKLIEQHEGITIKEIFYQFGEEKFREIESKVIEEIACKNNCVISIGGGAILREENVNNIKHNGIIYYLNRPVEQIVATSDRPLSSNRETLISRYNERKDIYYNTADYMIVIDSTLEDNINKVLEHIIWKF